MEVNDLIPMLSKLKNYGQSGLKVPIRGEDIKQLLGKYDSFSDFLPNTTNNAICEPLNEDREPLTHHKLNHFINSEFDLSSFGIKDGSRIAILLPNGPELAVTIMSVISHWCAAPINPTNTWEEIKNELESTKSLAIIILAGSSTNSNALKAAESLNLKVLVITPSSSTTGLFRLNQLDTKKSSDIQNLPLNSLSIVNGVLSSDNFSRVIMLLHTSGTSGNKKLVPYTLEMIIIGIASIISSWNLTPNDVCLNLMPLFHIGGIVRNIFSPILSGGTVITSTGFDPVLFWDILYHNKIKFTWYYAAPTMHHAILLESENRTKPLPVQTVRYLANAAGGLLPSLAENLRNTFDCVILTSYGMTECMPISSPPQNYALNPTGTSGIPVGPDILIVDENFRPVPSGVTGNILVSGKPCFDGYENSNHANDEAFHVINNVRWFDTGDMGYMDGDSYLFISGRSKEIINKGGETISPFEIEEVIVQHPLIKEVLAFSAPNAIYQETVGVIIVMKQNKKRIDLYNLHKYVESKLHRSKWPQVIVFMNGLPKNSVGKILRIKFSERCHMKNIDEDSSQFDRLYEGVCPPQGTPLTDPISIDPILFNNENIENYFNNLPNIVKSFVIKVELPSNNDTVVCFLVFDRNQSFTKQKATEYMNDINLKINEELDDYNKPSFIFEGKLSLQGNLYDEVIDLSFTEISTDYYDQLTRICYQLIQSKTIIKPRNTIEKQIELIWRENLLNSSSNVSVTTLSVIDSFFDIGGDSLKAGTIVNAIRKKMKIQISVTDLFSNPTIEKLAYKISMLKTIGSPSPSLSRKEKSQRIKKSKDSKQYNYHSIDSIDFDNNEDIDDQFFSYDTISNYSNKSFSCLFIQILPLLVFYPLRRIFTWFLIAIPWVYLMSIGYGRFVSLLAAMLIARLFTGFVNPLIIIPIKFVLLGKYKPGKYQLWSSMYLIWWTLEQIQNILGKGYYRDDIPLIGPMLTRFYYRCLGAKIGRNVRIHRDAKLGQHDLLTIEDNVTIDNSIIRPFSLDEGNFILLPIVIGSNSSIATKCIIAPGSVLPPNTCLGPLSSSFDIDDAQPGYRRYCRMSFSSPPMALVIFIGIPILLSVSLLSLTPWYICLKIMVTNAKYHGWYKSDIYTVHDAFLWWITPQRLWYYFLLRIVRRCVVPFIRLGIVILIKRNFIGKFTPLNENNKQLAWNRFKYWLMSKLLAGGNLSGVSRLVGTHYEVISIIYRLLGAKIGKRVYWPGSGLDVVEYDLLEIGDDVVFGSRSVILTSTSHSSNYVTLESGCMVADRCVILPGTVVHRGAVLGSGSLASENFVAPIGSVWVGSVDGRPVNVAAEDKTFYTKDTLSPFGRAFYGEDPKRVPYTVIPLWGVILYSTVWQAFCTCYRNSFIALSLIISSYLLQVEKAYGTYDTVSLFQLTIVSVIPLHFIMSINAILFDIASKWILLGKRKPGIYAWDQSSYCQRWQLYLTLQEIRRSERHSTGLLNLIQGSQYLIWYFKLLGSSIGNNVCLYPNGGDPMMTEPDLVTIKDDVAIDDASLIAHINTRGIFHLNKLTVQSNCVLKSFTRLLSGGSMDRYSILYEHSLVLAGEQVDQGTVWQGWPNKSQISIHKHRQILQSQLNTHFKAIHRPIPSLIYSSPSISYTTVLSHEGNEESDIESNVRLKNKKTKISKVLINNETKPLISGKFKGYDST